MGLIIRQVYKTSELVSDSINDGENDIDDMVAKNFSNTVVQVRFGEKYVVQTSDSNL